MPQATDVTACPTMAAGLWAATPTAAKVEAFLLTEGERLAQVGAAHYYAVRHRFNDTGSPLDFLFLSRACFNGLIRFNRKGEFNTPFCQKPQRFSRAYITKICNQVRWARNAIGGKDWEFACVDWQVSLSKATPGDFVYADPPYAGRHADYYNQWRDADASQLAQTLRQLPCRFLLSSWAENAYRRNNSLFDSFPDYQIATFSHYYHLGATEKLRHEMQEGLVIGNFITRILPRPSVISPAICHSAHPSVILSGAKNLDAGDKTLRYAQGDSSMGRVAG